MLSSSPVTVMLSQVAAPDVHLPRQPTNASQVHLIQRAVPAIASLLGSPDSACKSLKSCSVIQVTLLLVKWHVGFNPEIVLIF